MLQGSIGAQPEAQMSVWNSAAVISALMEGTETQGAYQQSRTKGILRGVRSSLQLLLFMVSWQLWGRGYDFSFFFFLPKGRTADKDLIHRHNKLLRCFRSQIKYLLPGRICLKHVWLNKVRILRAENQNLTNWRWTTGGPRAKSDPWVTSVRPVCGKNIIF